MTLHTEGHHGHASYASRMYISLQWYLNHRIFLECIECTLSLLYTTKKQSNLRNMLSHMRQVTLQ